MTDDELAALAAAPVNWTPWAGHQRLVVDDVVVFVKRVPLTSLEVAEPGSTRNVFSLPAFYSYGVGSAGFGAYRELGAHEAAAELVRSGVTPGSPLLYHHRVMPRIDAPPPFPIERSDYQASWNDNEAVARYIDARERATHELWLFSEHIAHNLSRWYPDHLDRTSGVLNSLRATASSFHDVGLVHFDAHFNNALTDGVSFYLCDFGLALSSSFDLDEQERAFLRRHRHYDHAEITWSLLSALPARYEAATPADRSRVDRAVGYPATASAGHVEAVLAQLPAVSDILALPTEYTATLSRYREVILEFDEFVHAIRRPAKDAQFNDRRFAELLARADRT